MMNGRWTTERGFAGRGLLMAAALLGTTALVGTLAVSPAHAQSNEELMKRIEKLEKSNEVTRGKKGVSLQLSGQINKMLVIVRDGNSHPTDQNTNVFILDNDNASSSRIRMKGEGKIDEKMVAGFYWEYESRNARASATTQASNGDADATQFRERQLAAYIGHKDIGTLWIGQTDTAGNGGTERSFMGVDAMYLSGTGCLMCGEKYRNGATSKTALTSVGPNDAQADHHDGRSRASTVKYVSPSFAGFNVEASYIGESAMSFSVNYASKLGPVAIDAGALYANAGDKYSSDRVGGSLAAEVAGFNVNLGGGSDFNKKATENGSTAANRTTKDNADWHISAGLGYKANFFSMGSTNIGYQYVIHGSKVTDNDEYAGHFAGVLQNIDSSGTELYTGLATSDYKGPKADTTDYKRVWEIAFGMRQKF